MLDMVGEPEVVVAEVADDLASASCSAAAVVSPGAGLRAVEEAHPGVGGDQLGHQLASRRHAVPDDQHSSPTLFGPTRQTERSKVGPWSWVGISTVAARLTRALRQRAQLRDPPYDERALGGWSE